MKEIYYQRFLEKELDSKHKKVKYGITDLTTENEHIEIKNWSDYKMALGQLCSYNQCDQKEKLSVYFFGEISDDKKLEIIDLFKAYNISVREFKITVEDLYIDNSKDFIIKKFIIDNFEIGNNKDYVKLSHIRKLLDQNIIKKDLNTVKKIVQDIFSEVEFKIDGKIDGERVRNVFCKLSLKKYNTPL